MKMTSACAILFLITFTVPTTSAVETNPLAKVFSLINQLKAKIASDGDKEETAFTKYSQWCGTTAKNVQYEIDTSTALEEKLTAKLTELASNIEVGDTKIKELSGAIAKAEAELNGATSIRKKEASEFAIAEKELVSTVDTLERALSELEKKLSGGSSLAQLDQSTLDTTLQALSTLNDAAAIEGSSQEKLAALIQAHASDDDSDMGAPAAAAYEKQSGGILDMLETMKDKAVDQLEALRKAETSSTNSYALLKQGIEDEVKASTDELNSEKSGKAEAEEESASAKGNLQVATKEKTAAIKKLEETQSTCTTQAADHEANVAARKEEMRVITEAEKILQETTGGAEKESYSFIQVVRSGSRSRSGQMSTELGAKSVINAVQHLAKIHHSTALAQLASRIKTELTYAKVRQNDDPFAKVRGLIESMIGKLEKEASSDATEKAYCDDEMAKTKTKHSELEDVISKLSAKIAKSASKSSQLKQDVTELQNELSTLAKEQAKSDGIRRDEAAAHVSAKADLEQGLGGVRKALTVLRDFYAAPSAASLLQDEDASDTGDSADEMSSLMQQASRQPAPPEKAEKSKGAGTGIISMLEVIESDLAKNLATEEAEESDSQSNYEKQTQANKITKAQKEQDAKFKTQEFKALDKSVSEMAADKATEVDEFTAVSQYFAKLKERCVAKPSSYDERKKRREGEITGLKDALATLEEVSLTQMGSGIRSHRRNRNNLRGDVLRADADVA